MTGGLLLLLCAIAVTFTEALAGAIILLPATYLLLLSNSYNLALYTARVGAWIGTLGRYDD